VLEHAAAHHPVVRRFVRGGFELPAEGVELPVYNRGHQVGRYVLKPSSGVGVSLEQRVVALGLADQVGAALAEWAIRPGSPLAPGWTVISAR